MPAQVIIRKLNRQQVEKAIADQNLKDKVTISPLGDHLLLSVKVTEPTDQVAVAAIQAIANSDAVLILKDVEAAKT